MAKKTVNPFVVSGKIAPEYFCDRVKESEQLIASIDNGRNLVLISPRRMGKTGLVYHCYDDDRMKDYYTFFIDILHTTSLQEFTYLLGRKIFDTTASTSRKLLRRFVKTLSSISGQFGYDPVSNTPTFSLSLGSIPQPEVTLEEIFQYLDSLDKPCVLTIDEFQQISRYQEKNIEALLRTYVQHSSNCVFVFAGSEYHIMQEMFLSASRPFYNSTDIMELRAIDIDTYISFVTSWMNKGGRNISADIITKVYRLFRGNTYGLQRTFNQIYSMTASGSVVGEDTVVRAIDDVIDGKVPLFSEQLSQIPDKQKRLLYAIACEGEVSGITSQAFIARHQLASASANQYAARQLIASGILTKLNGNFSVSEQFFDLWIHRLYGEKPLKQVFNGS